MNLGKKAQEAVLGKSIQALVPLMESLHAHLEIQSKELIKIRLMMKGRKISEKDVNKIIEEYQKDMS